MLSLSVISSIIHLVMDTENVSETRDVAPNWRGWSPKKSLLSSVAAKSSNLVS
jgi:hypothetical protein